MSMSGSNLNNDIVFDIGDYVELTQNRKGIIRFEGNIKFIGYVYGVELDEAIPGGTDGLLLGVRYFKCPKKRATFVKTTKIKSIITPRSSKHRIRKALHLPIHKNGNGVSKKEKKKKKISKNKSKQRQNNSKTKTKRCSKLPALTNTESAPVSASFKSRKRGSRPHHKPSLSLSSSSCSYTLSSLHIPKQSKKKIPRPRHVAKGRPKSTTLKTTKTTPRTQGTFYRNRKHHNEDTNISSDINQQLKHHLRILNTLTPFKKRQNALKQCIAIISGKQVLNQVFDFNDTSNEAILDDLVLKYFVDNFKKPFLKQIEDKKASIQLDVLHLLHILVKKHWILIKKYSNYYIKKLTIYFEKHDVKSTRKLIDPIIKRMIESLSMAEDKVIGVMMMIEFIQFATKSRSKMVKRNSWIYIGLVIKKQLTYSDKETSYFSLHESQQKNILDVLQSGLKRGISDSDKSTQSEAMSVLTLFAILDETRAERLIARLSGSVIKQYKKHNIDNIHNKRFTSPRASILTSPTTARSPTKALGMKEKTIESVRVAMVRKETIENGEDTYKDEEEMTVLSDDTMSSSDTEDTYSEDSGDSDDERRRCISTHLCIPSITIQDDMDDDTNKEALKSFRIKLVKKPIVPSLNTSMSKSANIYDRNANSKPNSARFNSNTKIINGTTRPSSAKIGDHDKKISFGNGDEDEEEEEDGTVVLDKYSDTDEDSDCSTEDEESSDEDDTMRTRDFNGFRESIYHGFMPKATAISYDALMNEYHFDTNTNERHFTSDDDEKDTRTLLFYPSYSYGRVDTMQILQHLPYTTIYDSDDSENDATDDDDENDHKQNVSNVNTLEHYLTIRLNPNVNDAHFGGRNKLNLILVLDQSESMGSTFNDEVGGKSKMMIANECICNLVDALRDDDRFALISFDDNIFIHTQSKLDVISAIDKDTLKYNIMNIKQNGGSNFEFAYEKANQLFDDLFNSNSMNQGYDNRIIMITDALIPHSLLHLFRKSSDKQIYTTFIAVSEIHNSDVVSEIHKQRGCNYFSVQSSHDFKLQLNHQFECYVTPLVFNVCLTLKTVDDDDCIADIYGINERERKHIKQSGEIQRIGTLFPLKRSNITNVNHKCGMILIKLKSKNNVTLHDVYNIKMEIKYEDREGTMYEDDEYISLGVIRQKHGGVSSHYDNNGIRKGILLCRYCRLLKQWMEEDVDSLQNESFLNVSEKWKNIFSAFIVYFKKEMKVMDDMHLQKEVDLLNKLVSFKSKPRNIFTLSNSKSNPLSISTSPATSVTSSNASSPRTQHSDITELIVSFLELKEARITWKMIEFLSNEPTTSIFMSFVSRMAMDHRIWMATIDKDINYTRVITEYDVFRSEDMNEIRLTQLSYALMNILSNENYAETIKSFLSRKCQSICLHTLAVFHPLSSGNAYHSRVILESLLNSNPKELLFVLTNHKAIRKLLKCALLRNIHRGNLNSFMLDLLCFQNPSTQRLYKQQTEIYHTKLLHMLYEWNTIPYILRQCHSPTTSDNISTKFLSFFSDLTTRCASVQRCAVLFPQKYATLIVDQLIGKGLIDKDNKRSLWTRVQCTQALIQFLDLCSRPSVLDQEFIHSSTNLMHNDMDESPNIFHSLFAPLLNRLHDYMPILASMVINEQDLKPIATTHGIIHKPFGQIRLNCVELITIAADFAQFECGDALAKIPISFFKSLLSLTFIHQRNNLFLVHFRRLIHLSLIFRRRILKELFVEHDMLNRFINYYNKEPLRSDLSAYIVQMLFDFYDHDKLDIENQERKKRRNPLSNPCSVESFDEMDEEDTLRANFSDEVEDEWSIVDFFDSCNLWKEFKLTVIQEIDAQTAMVGDVPNWDMGHSSKLDDLISSLLRTEDDDMDSMDDEESFRDTIHCGIIPSISSVSYYNVLNEYTFDVNQTEQRLPHNFDEYLCFPSFSFAKSKVTYDENEIETKYFLSINLNVNNNEKKERNKLNLAIVLDESESMSYYWNDDEGEIVKMECAINGISNILSNLNDEDRIGVIGFDQDVNVYQKLRLMKHLDSADLIHNLSAIMRCRGSHTDSRSSMKKSALDFENAFISSTHLFQTLFERFKDNDNEYDNRIIFISDYIPQSMSFVNLIKNCSQYINERICTSFISIGGYSCNAMFVNHLLRNRGCNCCCPITPKLFLDLTTNKDGAFDNIVTPLIYDLCLTLRSSDNDNKSIRCFDNIYGAKNENKQKMLSQCGEIYKNYTLFLGRRSENNGIILIELNNELLLSSFNQVFNVNVEMSFEDRDGRWYEFNQDLMFKCDDKKCDDGGDYYDNVAIRKGILLQRYAQIIKQRIEDHPQMSDLSKWKTKLQNFMLYFEKEMNECNDKKLLYELNVLQNLSNFAD